MTNDRKGDNRMKDKSTPANGKNKEMPQDRALLEKAAPFTTDARED